MSCVNEEIISNFEMSLLTNKSNHDILTLTENIT